MGGRIQRSVALGDIEYLRLGYAVESAVAENSLNLSALFGRATLERVDDRHGHFALTQIAGHGLPENAFRSCQIENVVDDLECHAEIASVLPKRVFLFRRCPAKNRAHPHADGKQASGLAVDEIEMLVERD